MNGKTIIIEGEEVAVEQLAMVLMVNIDTASGHSLMCSGLEMLDDELYRAHMASSYFSANTAVALCKKVGPVLESGDVAAFKACMEIAGKIMKAHKGFYEAFSLAYEFKPPALPTDLEERRATIRARFDEAVAAVAAVTVDVEALPAESTARATAMMVLDMVNKAVSEASSSVDFALGVATFPISDEQVHEVIADSMAQLTGAGGKTEEEARAMIAEKLGTTMEEHKAALVANQLAPLAPKSEGTLNGSLLSAEEEVATVVFGVGKVKELIAAK